MPKGIREPLQELEGGKGFGGMGGGGGGYRAPRYTESAVEKQVAQQAAEKRDARIKAGLAATGVGALGGLRVGSELTRSSGDSNAPTKKERQDSKAREDAERVGVGVMKKGGVVSASTRADGCAQRGKTRGKVI